MNRLWSTCVQGVGTLYQSRSLRFSDDFKEAYLRALGIEDGATVLEIGCGPGALMQSLARWYPRSALRGIDRDENFIRFAREKVPSAQFDVGDATRLPYEEGSFDVTLSHTVMEHVEPSGFLREQHRVLRQGGACLVLSVRRVIDVQAPVMEDASPLEDAIWKKVEARYKAFSREAGVGAYPVDERELPLLMERHGFSDVSTRYVAISLTPDDPGCSRETACAIFEDRRQMALESADALLAIAPEAVTAEEIEALKQERSARCDRRRALYNRGEKQWDTYTVLMGIFRGVKA
ncbi:MAG: methyltransferase domain-containing protein [Christensenellaceae bacterium]|nr:methyltransferase domain-containing protein [Christensenellaceae bacterium]